MSPLSPIEEMFDGRSVLVTGASGFLGRVLLEKLLRIYLGIKTIYILMRPKRNKSPQKRLNDHLLAAPIFDQIRTRDQENKLNNRPLLLDKIHVIEGDIGSENLGISANDLKLLLEDETLGIVFHAAATVKFDEPLRKSIQLNLVATKELLSLCKRLKNLLAFCHVSTAYVNSDIRDGSPIEEKIYPMQQTPSEVMELTRTHDESSLQAMKAELVAGRPNTYTYTKALAENLIAQEAPQLPVVIVRPSIVVAAWKEPIAGWIDNYNGPTGLIVAIGKGLLRSMHGDDSVVADMIPVDICINTMIAASYFTARVHNKLPIIEGHLPTDKWRRSSSENNDKSVNIFHCTSGDVNPSTWGKTVDMFFACARQYPSQQVFRYPMGSLKSNKYHDLMTRVFVHYLPALIIHLLCLMSNRRTQLLETYKKLHEATGSLTYFTTTNFNFKRTNVTLLESCLQDPRDRRELTLSVKNLNWSSFWSSHVLGARRFVLREKDETLVSSRQSLVRAFHHELMLRAFIVMIISLGIMMCI